jgi:hypothetical protein
LKKKPGLAAELNECMDYSVSEAEFETHWTAIIQKHEAGANSHLRYLFELQKCFIPLYYNQNFFPFIRSTTRSEGFNAVLKWYVNPHMSILNFVKQYMKIQEKVLSIEHENDFTSLEKV